MSDLTDFMLARIAEDERVAESLRRKSAGDPWGWQPRGLETCDKGRVDYPPARVLAECEAKRRIVEEWRRAQAEADDGDMSGRIAAFAFAIALQALALPYADHPDYREEWRP